MDNHELQYILCCCTLMMDEGGNFATKENCGLNFKRETIK